MQEKFIVVFLTFEVEKFGSREIKERQHNGL